MSQPEGNGGDGEHRQVVDGPLLVSSGDAAKLLQAVDESLHDIPFPVGVLVESDPALTFLAGDDHADPSPTQVPPDLLAAVALVAYHAIWANPWSSVPLSLDGSCLH